MAITKYPVTGAQHERATSNRLIGAGTAPSRTLAHARILLKADQSHAGPAWTDDAIAEAVEVSQPTVARVRKRYVCDGLDAALRPRPPRREYRHKLDDEQEAQLVALACSERELRRFCGSSEHLILLAKSADLMLASIPP